VVDDRGDAPAREQKLSFAQISRRLNQVANFLRSLGVQRGDRMLLMLPNAVSLWEVTLAAMKLGAIVSPATMLLNEADLQDRIERGSLRHVVADAAVTCLHAIASVCVSTNRWGEIPMLLP
jgi:acetyl-CoA synthetase